MIERNLFIKIDISGIKSLDGDTLDSVSTCFFTEFSPMRSSLLQVQQLAASYLEDISPDIINQLIYKYSIEAEYASLCDRLSYPRWDFYAMRWVTYRVVLDCILNSPVYIKESKGKVYKKLGDFAYSLGSENSSTGPVSSFIKKLECEAFKVFASVKHCKEPLLDCDTKSAEIYQPTAAQTMVKGEYVPGRPQFGRTIMKVSDYPAWTGYVKNYDRVALSNPY